MKRRVIGLTFAIVALACGSALAQDGGSIGIYNDMIGTSCGITAPQYALTNFYVLASPNVANTDGGVNGAEYTVYHDIAPADASLSATANPAANLVLGSPLNATVNIAFPACQPPDAQGFVLLHTIGIIVLNGANVVDKQMTIGNETPSNPNFQCPLINGCNAPQYTQHCVTPGIGYLNPSSGPGPCFEVSVDAATWSQVKGLYN